MGRVVAEEGADARLLRDDRLSFVTFPAHVNLTKSAELPRDILVAKIQQQPSIAKMLAKSLRLGDDSFLFENKCFKCFRVHSERKKAKWQNRMILFSAKSEAPDRRHATGRGAAALRLRV